MGASSLNSELLQDALACTGKTVPPDEAARLERDEVARCSSPKVRDAAMTHPCLERYWPSERVAVAIFGQLLGHKLGTDLDLPEALDQWESGACLKWRREKMRLDGQKQLEEIEQHKYFVSQRLGYDIGWENAARDWIERYAGAWRFWWEKQPQANPLFYQDGH